MAISNLRCVLSSFMAGWEATSLVLGLHNGMNSVIYCSFGFGIRDIAQLLP